MGKNLYKNRMMEFIRALYRIMCNEEKDNFKFNWTQGKVSFFEYKDKVGNEPKIVEKINKVLQENNKLTLVASLPSSGKTYLFANEIKKLNNITIFCVPNRNQAIQVANEYGLKRVVGGDTVLLETLANSKGLVFVYDKLFELIQLFGSKDQIDREFFNRNKISLVVDEAHAIIQDAFRKKTIDVLVSVVNLIKELGGNVIFNTASFEALVPFKFDETICLFSNSNANIPKTSIIIKPDDLKKSDFYANEIAKLLTEGKVVYCRLQNKTLPDLIMKEVGKLTPKEYSYIKINSDEKELEDDKETFKNKAVENVIKRSCLPLYDIYFCTSMIDAGTNIKEIINMEEGREIVPVFVYDSNNINIDNIEQSFNRLRFPYGERKILMCDSSYEFEELELEEIIKIEKEKVEKDKESLNTLYNSFKNYRKEDAKKLLELFLKQINEDGTMSIQNLKFNNYTDMVEIDELDFFRFCREKIYMKQFLNPDLLKQRLEKVLGGEIVFEMAHDRGVRVETKKVTEENRISDFKEMSTDTIRMEKFDNGIGPDFEKYKDTNILEMYSILRRKNNLVRTFALVSSLSEKELKRLCREISKQELMELDDNDKKALAELHNRKIPKIPYDKTKVAVVMNGYFKEYLIALLDRTNNINLTIKILINCENNNQIRNEILYLQSKDINDCYIKNLPAVGAFARKQYAFVRAVENLKESSSLSLYPDSKKTKMLIEEMNFYGYELKSKEILEMAERIFKGRHIEKTIQKENKKGDLVSKKVKGYQIWELNI